VRAVSSLAVAAEAGREGDQSGVSNILLTLAEEREETTESHFAVKHRVDEYDCYDFSSGLQALKHDVFYANWDDLRGQQFVRMFHDNRKRFIAPLALEEMDLIFVYKMEGFYFNLPRFFQMVQTFSDACPLVVNHPRTIRHNLDKRYLWELEKKGIRVVPTYYVDGQVRSRLLAGETFVLKPIRGERGTDVMLVRSVDELAAISGREDEYLAQKFMPTIRDGERSLAFLGFEYQHAVLKNPAPDNPQEFRCNESLGGTVAVYEPTPEELSFAVRVLEAYQSLGCPVHYSRVDLISTDDGPTLIEAELINPSIYANYSQKGVQFGHRIAHYFHRLLGH
jgi:glutathione synthase/RimK-type ligase-like ATP-grasp enzyme